MYTGLDKQNPARKGRGLPAVRNGEAPFPIACRKTAYLQSAEAVVTLPLPCGAAADAVVTLLLFSGFAAEAVLTEPLPCGAAAEAVVTEPLPCGAAADAVVTLPEPVGHGPAAKAGAEIARAPHNRASFSDFIELSIVNRP